MHEQFESHHQDALLQINVVRRTERKAQRAIYDERTRRLDTLRHFAQQADRNRRDARLLNHTLDQSHGLVAERSNRSEQDAVHSIRPELGRNFRRGDIDQPRRSGDRTHQAVVALCNPSDATLGF